MSVESILLIAVTLEDSNRKNVVRLLLAQIRKRLQHQGCNKGVKSKWNQQVLPTVRGYASFLAERNNHGECQ